MGRTEEDVLAGVGPRLHALRRARGATLADLATETGLTASTLSRLENGKLRPTLEQLLPDRGDRGGERPDGNGVITGARAALATAYAGAIVELPHEAGGGLRWTRTPTTGIAGSKP